jgi:hypothetical protein
MLLPPTNRRLEAHLSRARSSCLLLSGSSVHQHFCTAPPHRIIPHLALPRTLDAGRWTLDAAGLASCSSVVPCTSDQPLETLASTLPASSNNGDRIRPNCPLSAVPLLPPPPLCLCPIVGTFPLGEIGPPCDEAETLCRIPMCRAWFTLPSTLLP